MNPSISSYFNPMSQKHHALEQFRDLKGWQKFITIGLTALVTLVSLPILGLGGVATFRALTERFSVTPIRIGEGSDPVHYTAERTNNFFVSDMGLPKSKNETKVTRTNVQNEIEIDRIISRHPLAANFPELGMKEMQVLERRLEEVFIDEKIQEGYSSGAHPGIAFVDYHDVDQSILAPNINRIYNGYIYKTLLYMLLEGRIHFVAKARCGFCVGLEPLDQVDIKRFEFSNVYKKEDLLDIERFIKENTISTPDNTPADIITIVDLVVKEINEKLFNRVAYKHDFGIVVLKSEDLYKLNLGSESFVLAKKALNFLVNNNVIHSWNTHGNSRYGYCVRLDANDDINADSSIYSHEWKDITNIN